jgi:hypothetical protein
LGTIWLGVQLHPVWAIRLLIEGRACIDVGRDAFGWSALMDHRDTLFQVRGRE